MLQLLKAKTFTVPTTLKVWLDGSINSSINRASIMCSVSTSSGMSFFWLVVSWELYVDPMWCRDISEF